MTGGTIKKQEAGENVCACVHVSVCKCFEADLLGSENYKDSRSTVPQHSKQIGPRQGVRVSCMCACVCLTVSPGHRCWRAIPAWGSLINVKVTGKWGEMGAGWGRESRRAGAAEEEAEGVTRGDACLVLCLSLPVPWWNAESHERGPLSLSLLLRLVSCVCLKSTPVPLLTHCLSADFPSAPENAHSHKHMWKHTDTIICMLAYTHIQMCPSHSVQHELYISLKQEKWTKTQTNTHKISLSLGCLITMIITIKSTSVTNNHRVGLLTCHLALWWCIAWHSTVQWVRCNQLKIHISHGDSDIDCDTDRELCM